MRKVSVKNMVSTRLIRRILQRDIAKRAQKMINAISGNTAVFNGTQPSTPVIIAALILAFTNAEGEYEVGGILKRDGFLKARKALYAGVLSFAPYVNKIADGDNVILELSTLPLLSDELDLATLIANGALAANVKAIQSNASRQIVTNCDAFGPKAGYTVIVTEAVPLPTGYGLTSDGTFVSPDNIKCSVNSLGPRKKTFSDLLPQTQYFVYYALNYGTTVGLLTAGKSIVTSA